MGELHVRHLRGNLYRLLAMTEETVGDKWGQEHRRNNALQLLSEAEDLIDLLYRTANEG
jgi:hypothetical protein